MDEVLLLFREESPEVREGLEEELAWLSNKIIATEGVDLASEERVREGVDRARRILSLGLESLVGRNLERARDLLKERWLESVFRRGIGEIMALRDEARRTAKTYWERSEALLLFLDPPYEFIFQGLFRTLPQYYDPQVRDSVHSLRDFKSLEDVERTRRAVGQIQKIHEFLLRHFPNLFSRIKAQARYGEEGGPLFSFLGTSFASFLVRGKISTQPLTEAELLRFLKSAFYAETERRLKPASKEKFLETFFTPEERETLRPLWGLVFQKLEEELGGISPEKGIDPQFISAVRIKSQVGEKR